MNQKDLHCHCRACVTERAQLLQTRLTTLVHVWRAIPEEVLVCFLREHLTPRMRRQILSGLDAEESPA